MTSPAHKLPLREKIGYAMGDTAANFVWRGAWAYLPIFYTDTFGIPAAAAAMLLLLVRLSDGVTDIIMGMIADRTETRWGKFRPWVLWSAPALGLFMALTFITPDISVSAKLVYAYFMYIGLTLAYTISNVPYSALMGVMTPDHLERTDLSGWRFAGAFFGGLLVMSGTPLLVTFFGQGNEQLGYQYTMYLFSVLLVILLLITFVSTKERVKPFVQEGTLKQDLIDLSKNLPFIIVPLIAVSLFFYYRNITTGLLLAVIAALSYYFIKQLINKPESETSNTQRDLIDLLTNVPWLILLVIGFLFTMFNGIKVGSTAYYFEHYSTGTLFLGTAVGDWFNANIHENFSVLVDSHLVSLYFGTLLFVSMLAALSVGYITKFIDKRNLFIIALVSGGILTGMISFAGPGQVSFVFILGCASEFFAAIMPVLFFSMLGDAADYSEWKHKRRATGLVYSAGTFINKTGGGFSGAMILLVLAGYGYIAESPETIKATLPGIKLLMSWIPAAFAIIAAAIMLLYPLTSSRMSRIQADLAHQRKNS